MLFYLRYSSYLFNYNQTAKAVALGGGDFFSPKTLGQLMKLKVILTKYL